MFNRHIDTSGKPFAYLILFTLGILIVSNYLLFGPGGDARANGPYGDMLFGALAISFFLFFVLLVIRYQKAVDMLFSIALILYAATVIVLFVLTPILDPLLPWELHGENCNPSFSDENCTVFDTIQYSMFWWGILLVLPYLYGRFVRRRGRGREMWKRIFSKH
jgi:hypothetical protein